MWRGTMSFDQILDQAAGLFFSVCHITINSIPTAPLPWWPTIHPLNVLTGPWSVTGAHLLSGNIS